MLSVADAVDAVLREARPLDIESRSLTEAQDLALAETVRADWDSPPFDKSLVDGFAVRIADGAMSLPIVEVVSAGEVPNRSVEAGVAVQIMTGAPLPVGAEVVVPIEVTREQIDDDRQRRVEITTDISGWKPGTNIVRRGASTRGGDVVVEAGTVLRPQELGAIAELSGSVVRVRRRPRVAVLATGDELVPIEQTPGPGQIRNSNEIMLCAQVFRAGGEPVPLGVARDERAELSSRIAASLSARATTIN